MSKHTPGPWKVGKNLGARSEVRLIHYDAGVKGPGAPIIEGAVSIADARLIAAAPDLLAVLKELEESSGYWSEYDVPLGIVDRIRSAIAKAEGVQ